MQDAHSHLERVRALVAGLLTTAGDADALSLERPLYELGLDSLATVNLMVSLAEAAGVDLEDFVDDVDTPRTIGDLCALAARFDAAPAAR